MHHFKQHLLSCPAWHRHLSTFFLGEEYIKSLIANPELVDRLALSDDDKVSTTEPIVFTVNLPRCCSKLGLAFGAWIWTWICIPSFQSFTSLISFLRMRSPAVRCCSRSTSLCPGFRQESRVVPSSRAPSGPAGTTIWRPQSLSREREKIAQRCVCVCL